MIPNLSSYSAKSLFREKLPCSLLQFIVQILFFNIVGALKYPTDSACGDTNLTGSKGTITSPNYPRTYPNAVKCEWKIHSPAESILKINIADLDIEEDRPCLKPPCCSHEWLLVPSEGGRGTKLLCGNNATEKTIIVSQPVTIIKYFSANTNKNGRGFEITYSIDMRTCMSHELICNNGKCVSNNSFCNGVDDCGDSSDEMYCFHISHASSKYDVFPRKVLDISSNNIASSQVCSDGKVPCPSSPDHCYLPHVDICDGEFDCPKGEDEVGCAPGCPKQIACSSGDGCYYPSQRCNLKRNCRDNSDETGCPAAPCIALQFTCLNGACISGTAICDGIDDCGDLSDEENCTKSSFMTAAIMGLLSCIFLFCIGLSCLYRVYAARLRASAGFAHQLEPEPMDDEFMYREPPPAYSVAIGDTGVIPYPAPEFMERYFEPDQSSRSHRTRYNRHNRRRHRSGGASEQISTPRSRPRPSGAYTALGNSNLPQYPEQHQQPKRNDCSKNEPAASRPNFEGVIELLGFPEEVATSQTATQENTTQSRSYTNNNNESPCSSPSLSPSRESVTSSTSLEDHEDLVRSCQS